MVENNNEIPVECEVECECPFCGKTYYVRVGVDSYSKWQLGLTAQEAFPYLSLSKREQLISGVCPKCQKTIF